MKLRSIHSARLKKGTRVILRTDFDVNITKGKIVDPFRIHENIPTIRFLLKKGCKIRIITKIGRPKGKYISSLSVRPVIRYLERVLGRKIRLVNDPTDKKVFSKLSQSSEILFFENIRFWPGEERGGATFARVLARWGDVYINENFASSHGKDVSVYALAKLLPSFAGLHFLKEVRSLSRIVEHPRRPLVAILSGAKLEIKLPLIERFLKKGGLVLLGGILANTLLHARGISIGSSLIDKTFRLPHALKKNKNLYLPEDAVLASSEHGKTRIAEIKAVGKREIIFDIGPKTIDRYSEIIRGARTVIWNGPMGRAEIQAFATGTKMIAKSIQRSKSFSVVGGGDTLSILAAHGLRYGFDHLSTGGGVMLEFLSGKKLPPLEVLKK